MAGNSEKAADKRKRFAQEYLIDLNGAAAAIRAGFSAKRARATAHKLLQMPDVQRAVQEGKRRQAESADIQAVEVLRELKLIALSDLGRCFSASGRLLSIVDMPEAVRRAIAGVDVVESVDTDGRPVVIKKLKFWDKNKALEQLGRHLKLFTDVQETRFPQLSPEEAAERVKELLSKARARKEAE